MYIVEAMKHWKLCSLINTKHKPVLRIRKILHTMHTGTQRMRTKHPDIAEAGEASEVDALGRHPLNGQLASRGDIVVSVFQPA